MHHLPFADEGSLLLDGFRSADEEEEGLSLRVDLLPALPLFLPAEGGRALLLALLRWCCCELLLPLGFALDWEEAAALAGFLAGPAFLDVVADDFFSSPSELLPSVAVGSAPDTLPFRICPATASALTGSIAVELLIHAICSALSEAVALASALAKALSIASMSRWQS